MLEAVFCFIARNDPESFGVDCIEINLSVAQCMDRNLPDTVLKLQHQFGIDPHMIKFEITETTFDHISNIGRENLSLLSRAGYAFALDDYGTGFSNIQRLSRIEFGVVKIDRSMVEELVTDEGRLIMKNTIHMMHDLRKQVVAEGVETEEQLKMLREMGVESIQGFYYSRPLPEEEYKGFLREHC